MGRVQGQDENRDVARPWQEAYSLLCLIQCCVKCLTRCHRFRCAQPAVCDRLFCLPVCVYSRLLFGRAPSGRFLCKDGLLVGLPDWSRATARWRRGRFCRAGRNLIMGSQLAAALLLFPQAILSWRFSFRARRCHADNVLSLKKSVAFRAGPVITTEIR